MCKNQRFFFNYKKNKENKYIPQNKNRFHNEPIWRNSPFCVVRRRLAGSKDCYVLNQHFHTTTHHKKKGQHKKKEPQTQQQQSKKKTKNPQKNTKKKNHVALRPIFPSVSFPSTDSFRTTRSSHPIRDSAGGGMLPIQRHG